ncbi:uncharacterized protein KY384_008303 [Bacidia gigantensis]|uniref:uncharacterized protein n=1 Tax=Bacidia gigantensis TaxID=2732470 RepID=UPI001D0409A3|nr:uncharacterized protein KY384_008303 [Bacidia gigantensis]KAG8526874.1 hypothetical protein KY384_008303 [Bacidia gigantensis]
MTITNMKNTLDARSMRGARLLQISHVFGLVSLLIQAPALVETNFDPYVSKFQRIIDLARLVLEPQKQEVTDKTFKIEFVLDMQLVAPLYAVAHRCRDPVIRREAVYLLKHRPWREGLWDSSLAAVTAEKIISLEEESLVSVTSCHDVPEWARIRNVDVEFDVEGRLGKIKYTRRRAEDNGTMEEYVDQMQW